jgi:hypothetical protein
MINIIFLIAWTIHHISKKKIKCRRENEMSQKQKLNVCFCIVLSLMSSCLLAEEKASDSPAEKPSASSAVSCSSAAGEQQHCTADTTAGVILLRTTVSAACLLGNTWGYDSTGIWVKEGCSGDFMVNPTGASAAALAGMPGDFTTYDKSEEWGEFAPGKGFLIARSEMGEARLGG